MMKLLIKIEKLFKGYLGKNNKIELVGKVIVLTGVILTYSLPVLAASNPDTKDMDDLIKWIAAWTTKIGLVVAFFGGIQTSLGFKNDDADGKVRGLKTLASGFMVAGISKSLDLFGLTS